MSAVDRRRLLVLAATLGASAAWARADARPSRRAPILSAGAFAEGVASADPAPDGMILWTRRRPLPASTATRLTVEVSEDAGFQRVAATARATLSAEADWTCRVLVGGLKPGRLYWYRFVDEHGLCSRTGRTFTAPAADDDQPVRFAFVSCQNPTQGPSTAFRRMIWEDEQRRPEDQLQFVLHLGDFIYEMTWYPEDRPQGMYARRLRDLYRLPHGEKIGDFHVPTTAEDYRTIYRAYLADPDIQDARARWPFICVWDNHEFSNKGWQSQTDFGKVRPAQTLKVAANQAWFEYIPARVKKAGGLDRFEAPKVVDAPLADFDDHGLSHEPNNLAAVNSLGIARTLRFGRNVDLLLTDDRSFRSQPVFNRREAAPFQVKGFPWFAPQEVIEVLDAGRTCAGGRPPEAIRFGGHDLPNPMKDAPAGSMLGEAQKAWFFDRLERSQAVWKLWGNSVGMLHRRTDFRALPADAKPKWPGEGYAINGTDDWCGYPNERAEILERVRASGVTNFASLVGDRHAFFAGTLSAQLPPHGFAPVGVEFITGSIGSPTHFEAAEHSLPKTHPLYAAYLHAPATGGLQPALNVTLMHGVASSLALATGGDAKAVLAARDPAVAPHLAFADVSGHGYATVRADAKALEVEFVGLPRPVEPTGRADGDTPVYRVVHRTPAWRAGETPVVERVTLEGEPPLVL